MLAHVLRGQLNKQCDDINAQLGATQAKLQKLRAEENSLGVSRNSKGADQGSIANAEPWKLYEKLQEDFKDALKDARQRDARRR